MKINFKQIIFNITPADRNIEYLVIHDTGNRRIGANAEAHFNYFNSENRNASADFFVDDEEILQVNDYNKNFTWHCGDGKGQYGITNRNSIGIEMCVNSDGDFDKTFENTIFLVKEIKKVFPNIKVVRHYDASRKICPASLSHNNWQGWQEFLSRVDVKKELNWKQQIVKEAFDLGLLKSDEWIEKAEDKADVWFVCAMLINLEKKLSE